MNEVTIKTSQAANTPLSPVGNTIPTPTTQVSEAGETRNVDTGATLKDSRPYSAIFAEELAKGNLDVCENANQINRHLQELKGAQSPCTFFVNARSHGWSRTNGKWIAPTEEWLRANPYTPGTRAAGKTGGMLSDAEVEAIKAQLAALDLVPQSAKSSVQPIMDALTLKLLNHEKAVSEAAISKERIENRRNALACTERILKAIDSMGGAWNASLYANLLTLGATLPDDQLAACLFGYPESK